LKNEFLKIFIEFGKNGEDYNQMELEDFIKTD